MKKGGLKFSKEPPLPLAMARRKEKKPTVADKITDAKKALRRRWIHGLLEPWFP